MCTSLAKCSEVMPSAYLAGEWKATCPTGLLPILGTQTGETRVSVAIIIVANLNNIIFYCSGFFNILRGQNEVGIESGCAAGMPKKYMP